MARSFQDRLRVPLFRCSGRCGFLSLAVLLSAVLAFPLEPAGAALDATAEATVNTPDGQLMDSNPLTGVVTGPILTSAHIGGGTVGFPGSAQASAAARAEYGRVGISAGAGAIGPDDSSGAQFSSWGSASAGWTDTLTIVHSGFGLQPALVRVTAEIRGLMTLPVVADYQYAIAEYILRISVGCGTPGCTLIGQGRVSYNPPTDPAIVVSGVNLIDFAQFTSDPVPVLSNQPISIAMSLSGLVQAYAYSSGRVEANIAAYDTATWGGFLEVRDAQGNLVTDYTVVSLSGVDWSKPVAAPVPEPGTLMQMLLGIAVLLTLQAAARMRRRAGVARVQRHDGCSP